jgi:hypothetical protein
VGECLPGHVYAKPWVIATALKKKKNIYNLVIYNLFKIIPSVIIFKDITRHQR